MRLSSSMPVLPRSIASLASHITMELPNPDADSEVAGAWVVLKAVVGLLVVVMVIVGQHCL
jgi:hypothetical protein